MVGLCATKLTLVRSGDTRRVYYNEPLGLYVKIDLRSDREAAMIQKLNDAKVPHRLEPQHMIRWRKGFLMVTKAYSVMSHCAVDPGILLRYVICILEVPLLHDVLFC